MQMTKKSRVLLIAFLGIMSAMAPLATDMYLPALPALSSEFSASTSATQLTLTMTMLGMAIGQIFLGPLSDMYGRKAPLFFGMIVFALVSAGCCFAFCKALPEQAASSSRVPSRVMSRKVSSSRAFYPSLCS